MAQSSVNAPAALSFKDEATALLREALELVHGQPRIAAIEAAQRFVLDVSACLAWSEGKLKGEEAYDKLCSMVPQNLCGMTTKAFVSSALKNALREACGVAQVELFVALVLCFTGTLCIDFGEVINAGKRLGVSTKMLTGWIGARVLNQRGVGVSLEHGVAKRDFYLCRFLCRLVMGVVQGPHGRDPSVSAACCAGLLAEAMREGSFDQQLLTRIAIVEAISPHLQLPACKSWLADMFLESLCLDVVPDKEDLSCIVLVERLAALVCVGLAEDGILRIVESVVPRLASQPRNTLHPEVLRSFLRCAHESCPRAINTHAVSSMCTRAVTAAFASEESARHSLLILAMLVFQESLMFTKGFNNCLSEYYKWITAVLGNTQWSQATQHRFVAISSVFVQTMMFDPMFALIVHKTILEEAIAKNNLHGEEASTCREAIRKLAKSLVENRFLKLKQGLQPKKKRAKLSISDRFKVLVFKGQTYEIKDKRLLQVSYKFLDSVDKMAQDLANGRELPVESIVFLKVMRKSVFETQFLSALFRPPFSKSRLQLGVVLARKIEPPLVPEGMLTKFESLKCSGEEKGRYEVELGSLHDVLSRTVHILSSGSLEDWNKHLKTLNRSVAEIAQTHPEVTGDLSDSLLNTLTNVQYCRRNKSKSKHDIKWLKELCRAVGPLNVSLLDKASRILNRRWYKLRCYQLETIVALAVSMEQHELWSPDIHQSISDSRSSIMLLKLAIFIMNSNLDKTDQRLQDILTLGKYVYVHDKPLSKREIAREQECTCGRGLRSRLAFNLWFATLTQL